MSAPAKMTTVEAVQFLRKDPRNEDLIRDSYLELDVQKAADRFFSSAEFAEAVKLLDGKLNDGIVVDVGAGTGIASYAFARSGARLVYALEPDPSEVGRAAIARLTNDLPVEMLDGFGESIPLPDTSVDVVYARQVLHHARDLECLLKECARILKVGGKLLVCREHVADDENQLKQFLADHPIQQLAGGEHAYQLDRYMSAIKDAGLKMSDVLGPWDCVMNAFPAVRTEEALRNFPKVVLTERLGAAGSLAALIPGVRSIVWKRIKDYPTPGRLYSFLAVKA
jgi:ubiquinone/menaquinone biosynthesis C-methylase UbiE